MITFLTNVYTDYCNLRGFSPIAISDYESAYKTLSILSFTFNFIAPFLLMAILNGAIIRSLYKAAKQRQDMTKSSTDQERKITKVLIAVTVIYFILVGPKNVFLIVESHEFKSFRVQQEYVEQIFTTFHKVNYSINFFIYTLCGSKYRESFFLLFKRESWTCRRPQHVHVV